MLNTTFLRQIYLNFFYRREFFAFHIKRKGTKNVFNALLEDLKKMKEPP